MELENKKIPLEIFLKERERVLSDWVTGSSPDLDLDKAVEYLKSIPEHKNFAMMLMKAKAEGKTLIQPRAGVPVLEEHIKLLKHLEQAGADCLPSTIDSYTRQNRYLEAEKGIKESKELGRALLNGFPVVNHGVEGCKKVQESVNVPLQARHGTPDARLLTEIIFASGWTSNEGGGISYNIPYAKSVPLETTIRNWQYCDRLVGYYEEHGIHLNREPFGPLTGTLVPPSISAAIGICEALLAAEQGVKNITVGYGMGGNIIQDVAAIKMLQILTEKYLKHHGYNDVFVSTVFHQWMGGFPDNEAEAAGLIALSSTVAALSNATKMITKSPQESVGIPTAEANAYGIKESKYIITMLRDQTMADSEKLREEMHQIEVEVDCLMECIYKVGDQDLAKGIVRAFQQGLIDVPFAPSRFNAGKILPARDLEGNIRILEFGHTAFNDEIKKFHHQKIQERADFQHRPISFQLTVDDVYSVSLGKLIGHKL